jgi:zinc transport system substrate-binding protein
VLVGILFSVAGGLSLAGGPVATALSPAARKERLRVVAAFYPLAWAVAQVGGDHVRVDNLTPAGAEPHDLELTPSQRDAIEDAALVIVMGEGFQPAIEDAASDRDEATVAVLDRLPIDAGGKKVEEARDDSGAGGLDPHVWLDPVLMRDVVDEVARALAKADRSHAQQYRANAVAVKADLTTLDDEFTAGLGTCKRDLIVTAHDAFGYLAHRYGLRQQGVAGISPDAEPNPGRLADLADLVEREGVTTIFTEDLVSPKIAKTLAREAGGVKTAVLHPLEGLTDEQLDDGADYLSEMRANLDRLEQALGCAPA